MSNKRRNRRGVWGKIIRFLKKRNNGSANLSYANLSYANLSYANFSDADLSYAILSGADLRGADLRGADLRGAILSDAILSDAILSGADLRDADLSGADLRDADLSGVVGLPSTIEFLERYFEFLEDGSMVVYKTFNNAYSAPSHWVIEAGSIITSPVNPDRGTNCGSGINVAKRDWNDFGTNPLWKCIIKPQWLGSVVVPFDSDGKIRCERIQLVEIVENK